MANWPNWPCRLGRVLLANRLSPAQAIRGKQPDLPLIV